ncbi:PREDICTED: uncharacterized protein LOC104801295 [Tarenaya hassleriana]|uniref:uncharacterized protein LOC104801295 n=1 Tax=Tarenaya hassleriana TaxID=28532 RepID=UPI00053C5882|nr:PREDICTED: uncharacterized protein LOC104801295 [Tarenaya hassleriana]
MQSRLAFAVASRFSVVNCSGRALAQGVASRSASNGRTADPDIHSGNDGADPAVYPKDPEGMDDVANPKAKDDDVSIEDENPRPSLEEEPISPVNLRASAHKLENTAVGRQGDPNFQQKRKISTAVKA